MDSTRPAPMPTGLAQRRIPAKDIRPAWAQPQTPWPFRVIDPASHRAGAPAQAAPGWSS